MIAARSVLCSSLSRSQLERFSFRSGKRTKSRWPRTRSKWIQYQIAQKTVLDSANKIEKDQTNFVDFCIEKLGWECLALPLGASTLVNLLIKPILVSTPQILSAIFASTSFGISTSSSYTIGEKITYLLHQVISKQLFGKLMAVVLCAVPIVIIGGFLLKLFTGEKFSESMFKAYSIMGDVPGADAVSDDSAWSLLIGNLIFVAGLFTVAVTLGIVCDDISNSVSTARTGNYQIVERNHVVILNVNPMLGPVLRQIAIAAKERGTFKCPIVILADMDKDELDGIVEAETEGLNLNVFTRKGCTHAVMDLKRAAAGLAKNVIWLEPEDSEVSVAARRACAIASLKALGIGERGDANITVQTSTDSSRMPDHLTDVPLAIRTPPFPSKKLKISELQEEENFDRLIAQCALQPGLGRIYSHLFEQGEGVEFYLTSGLSFGGMKFSEARRKFDSSIVCGIYKEGESDSRVLLNPSEEEILGKSDRLIVICDSNKNVKASNNLPSPSKWTQKANRIPRTFSNEHIVVLCFGLENQADSGVIESIGLFAPKGTKVTVVSKNASKKAKVAGQVKLEYIEGDPTHLRTLKKLSESKIDSIVFAGLEDLPPKIADAQLISSLIQIEEAANKFWEDKSGFNIVSSLNFDETKQVADHLIEAARSMPVPISLDVLLPKDITSGVLVQIVSTPALERVFKEILTSEGNEVYIRDAREFDLVGKGKVKSFEVSDVVRRFGETFIGIVKRDNTDIIAPKAMSEYEFMDGDKIIVIASNFTAEETSED